MGTYIVGKFEASHVGNVLPQGVFAIHLPREERWWDVQRCAPSLGIPTLAPQLPPPPALRNFPSEMQ